MPNVTFKFVLNNKPKRSGLYTLLLRITMNRKIKYVSTGYDIPAKAWNDNPKKMEVRSSYDLAWVINQDCKKLKRKAELWVSKQEEQFTIDELQAHLQGKEQKALPHFVEWCEHILDLYYPLPSRVVARKHMKTTIEVLKDIQAKKGRAKLLFRHIDLKFVKEFENYLLSERKSRPNTIAGHLKRLKRFLIIAVEMEVIPYDKNPFLGMKIKKSRTSKPRLTMDEVKKLEELELPKGRTRDARNAWLLQFYLAGTRIGDMLALRFANIQDGRLSFEMQKTEEQMSVKLSPRALAIIEEYRTEETVPADYILPFLSKDIDYSDPVFWLEQKGSKTAQINASLKDVAKLAKLEKNLTTHMARHTFADVAHQKTKDLHSVSKLLRHGTTRQTEDYLGSFNDTSLDSVVDSVLDY